MALDGRYVTTVSLDEYFVLKDTGEPNSFGTIEFWQDDNRVVPKNVFQLTGAPPNYTYTALPNPITLSAVGTPSDVNGNNVAIYYFPYDANDDIQLYYVVVRDQFGVVQETREAWPNVTDNANPGANQAGITNELSNPQFVDVNFLPTNPRTLNVTGAAITTIPIAPRWDLVVDHTATTTVTVQRTAVQGSSAYPGNPPFTLTITPGLNVQALTLRQRLENNPDIFSRAAGGTNGYISGSVLLAPGSSLEMQYQPNGQPTQQVLVANNGGGAYAEFNNTIQLAPAANPSTGDTGYVDILLVLPVGTATTLSNVQIVGLDSNIQNVGYDQVTANRQKDQLFNYYNPLLQAKPIRSYLVGWNFPQNPTQFLGPNLAASAAGANTSRYVWDQTIVFQSANNGAAISRSAAGNGALRITATNATQFALIQYLPQVDARKILNNSMSATLSAITAFAGGLGGTISLWYTTDAMLPSTAANQSLVATIDANGKPATFNGNWTEVPRSGLGDAQFTVGNSATTNFNDYSFNGWDVNGIAGANTATFFAIVVGFAQLGAAATIDIDSISLVPGDIPTRPAPQSDNEVLADCQRYYEMSFNIGTVPAQNLGTASGMAAWFCPAAAVAGFIFQHFVYFKVPKHTVPLAANIITYNPQAANAEVRAIQDALDQAGTAILYESQMGFGISIAAFTPGTNSSSAMGVCWTCDARLGL